MCKRFFLLLIIIAGLLLTSCQLFNTAITSNEETETPVERTPLLLEQQATLATVYYTTTDHKWLVPLTIPINATREVARVAVEKLLSGAPNEFVGSVIPPETKLIYLYTSENIVYLDLTKDFLTVDPENANLALQSLCTTVLPKTYYNSLQILIEGEIQDSIGGIDTSKPFSICKTNLVSENNEGFSITYYFSDQQAMYLVPQTVVIPLNEIETEKATTQFLAEKIMEKLLTGPDEESGLSSTIWQGTQLNSITVKDGVATVDLSSDVLGYGGGATAEQCLINSLVYSLTSLSDVKSVQLLIDGEKQEYLPEGSDISQPLTLDQPINMIN